MIIARLEIDQQMNNVKANLRQKNINKIDKNG